MRKKLLFLAIIFLSVLKSFAQAEAYPAPNIYQCGNEVFDLTVQTPIVLGNQDPENYTVTYFTTQMAAEANFDVIAQPQQFVGQQQQIIFARVTNNDTADYDVTSFMIGWGSFVSVPEMPDVTVCENYTLPALQVGAYYNQPGGVGPIPVSQIITQTQTVYIYAGIGSVCTAESSFTVTVLNVLTLQPTPLYECDVNNNTYADFDLTEILPQVISDISGYSVTFHHSSSDAETGVNEIENPQNFTNMVPGSETLYLRVASEMAGCFWVIPFQIVITECTENVISGFVSLNTDDDCDTFEGAAANIPVYYSHVNDVYVTYTNADGYYSFENVPDGNSTVYINSTAQYTVSPSMQTVTMPSDAETNFCLTPPGPVEDVAVYLYPIVGARPGMTASYILVYQNLGTVAQSGTVTLQFDNTKMDYLSSLPVNVPVGNTFTINYTDLPPLAVRVVGLAFTVHMPQQVPAGTILNFSANITPLEDDDQPQNNAAVLNQTVVNSYDPNDIAVREGEFITEEQADDYLHYTIRFQNMGTASAINVRVVTMLDENLDWDTFQPISASHAFKANRIGNEVQFLFDNINLPYEDEDEAGSNGHIIFRIKPKSTVTLGDSMSAQAHIYFDFNDAVDTNIVTTTVQETAGVDDISANLLKVYPNPANDYVTIHIDNTDASGFEVAVTDVTGKVVLVDTFSGNTADVNVSSLTNGVYFVKVASGDRQMTKKLVIR